MEDLEILIEKWESSALELKEAERLITLLVVDNRRLERERGQLIAERDHWEDKATEMANDIGKALGFSVGEHSNVNCPVKNAIDGLFEMGAQIDDWKSRPKPD